MEAEGTDKVMERRAHGFNKTAPDLADAVARKLMRREPQPLSEVRLKR